MISFEVVIFVYNIESGETLGHIFKTKIFKKKRKLKNLFFVFVFFFIFNISR